MFHPALRLQLKIQIMWLGQGWGWNKYLNEYSSNIYFILTRLDSILTGSLSSNSVVGGFNLENSFISIFRIFAYHPTRGWKLEGFYWDLAKTATSFKFETKIWNANGKKKLNATRQDGRFFSVEPYWLSTELRQSMFQKTWNN